MGKMKCNHCGSKNLVKCGKAAYGGKLMQRWSCKDCYRQTVETGKKRTKNVKPK